MKKGYVRYIVAGLLTILLTGSVYATVPVAHAQSLQYWSNPVNLSNSGSSTDPLIVIDSDGVIHVAWVDAIDGYKFTESADGKVWTPPTKANFPFSAKGDSRPALFANANGIIYIVWRDKANTLYVGQTQSKSFSNSSSWTTVAVGASSTVPAFDAVVDSQGALDLSYVSVGAPSSPAGVYYSQVSPKASPKPVNIFTSQYFRSLDSGSAHVKIATSKRDGGDKIYIAWDDRPQKRILMAESLDGGKTWGQTSQIMGPEAVTGLSIPFNIDIGVMSAGVLLTWQIGQPGGQCTNYSEWSANGGAQFGQPVKLTDQSPVCAQAGEFVLQNQDFSVLLFNALDDISLVAWNGSAWSKPQAQSEIVAFTNPETFDSVILGCEKVSAHGANLYLVGCDKGNGGDIWFSSRSLGAVGDWFPPASAWSTPVQVASVNQEISALSSTTDGADAVHAFWIQTPLLGTDGSLPTIQYARWNSQDWSTPVPVISQLDGSPMQLNVTADGRGRLLLAWIDGKTGQISFSWANAQRASNPGEWQTPQYVTSASQVTSSPAILADASGRIIVAYAIPINEQRGIYLVESDDSGTTWTQPFRAFDAAAAGWEMVDQPNISLTGDGRLHILFRRYSLIAQQRQSAGLYYSQSADGGVTWSNPEAVSEDSVSWSQIVGYGRSIVHRLWQQDKQSVLLTFHEFSKDGGLTWSRPAAVSSGDATNSLSTLTIDRAGNLDLLQLKSTDTLVISDRRWDGSAWTSQASKELYFKDRGLPSSIIANITSKGNLLVSVAVDYPFLTDGVKDDIVSVGRSVGMPEAIQTPYPAVIAAPKTTAIVVQETPGVPESPTTASPLAGLNDSPSFLSRSKNLVGLLLLGGILVVIVLVFRPAPIKQNSRKKASK